MFSGPDNPKSFIFPTFFVKTVRCWRTRFCASLILLFLTAFLSVNAQAQKIDFENGFTPGIINGQNGWGNGLNSGGAGCQTYDHNIVNNYPNAPASFGTQSLQISNYITSGCFDQTFSSSTTEAGETTADSGSGASVGPRQKHFEAQFDVASATPGTAQTTSYMSVSPDRGDGARMSYLRFEDQADGIHVFFDEYIDALPYAGDSGNVAGSEDGFTDDDITTLSNSAAHNIRFVMDFVDGPRNDVVKIYIDGVLAKTGTSWEDYFRYDPEQTPSGNKVPTVDSLLFRTGGATDGVTHSDNQGKGFLIDNVLLPRNCASVAAPYNVVTEFAIGSNSNCEYTYGNTDSADPNSSNLNNYTKITTTNPAGEDRWYRADNDPFLVPTVFTDKANSRLILHPGYSGERSVVRFTAPADAATALYKISGSFTNGNQATTDDLIIHRSGAASTILFTGAVDNPNGVNSQPFTQYVNLAPGDIIDFSVGYGSNGTYDYDSTGLDAVIEIESDTTPPTVTSISRNTPSSVATNAASVIYKVVFSEAVTGVDKDEFTTLDTGSLTGSSVTGLTGSGANYLVTVDTGTGNGTVSLKLVDDDSIIDAVTNPLGGAGANNGSFNGDPYTINKTPLTISSVTAVPSGPTNASTITFTAKFSTSIISCNATGYAADNGTVGTPMTSSSNSRDCVIEVTPMGGGTPVTLHVNAGAATDAAGNSNADTSSASVDYDGTMPTVKIAKASNQVSPTSNNPINFTVTFSKPVNGFDDAATDVDLTSSTAGGTLSAVITEIAPMDGTTYNVAVSGATSSGDVVVSVPAGVASDALTNSNAASTTPATVAFFVPTAAACAATAPYDVVSDFTIARNPNCVWSYGSTVDADADSVYSDYTRRQTNAFVANSNIDGWYRADADEYNVPGVYRNDSENDPQTYLTVEQPKNMLNLHPGLDHSRSIIRFKAPADGDYQVAGKFQGIDTGNGDRNVDVRTRSGANPSVSVLTGNTNINTFGGTVPFTTTVTLTAGDFVEFSVDDNGQYFNDSTGLSAVVKLAQTISFTKPTDKVYGNAPFDLVATASSDLPVTFASNSTSVCTVNDSTVTIVGAGTCSITASQAGNAAYAAAENVTQTFEVAKATATISLSNLSQTYNGSPRSATATTNPAGLAVVSITYNGNSTAPTDAGSYAVVASLDNPNYTASNATGTLVIAKANQTITFDPIPNKNYGDADFTLTASASSGLTVTYTASSSPVAGLCTVSGSTVHIAGAGSCTITAHQVGDNNYNAALDVDQTFTITTQTTDVALDITDTTTHVTRATLPASGPVTVSVPVTVGDVTSHGFTSFDFTVSYDSSKLTPKGPEAVMLATTDVAYPFGSGVSSNVSPSAGSLAVQGNGQDPLTGSGRLLSLEFTASNIGCSTITFGSPSSFYFNADIYPTPVTTGQVCIAEDTTTTVTFGSGPFPYTGNPYAATATTTGNRTNASLTPVITYGGNCTNVTSTNGCTATANYAGDDTHNMSSATASITITKRQITVSATASDKPYDGNTTATVVLSLSPAVSGGSANYTSATFDTADVGTGKTVTVSGISLSGVDLDNNELVNTTAMTTASITQASQTITFNSLSDKLIGSPDFNISATGGGSGNPVTFATASSACTVTSTGSSQASVHIVTYGVCTITASQAGSDNYNAAPDVSQSFNVVPYTNNLNVSLPAGPASSYHGQPFAVPVSISETGLNGINTITFDLTYDSSLWNPATTFVTGASFNGTVTTTVSGGVVHVTISSSSPSSYLSGAGSVILNFASSNTGSSTFSLSNFVYSSNTPTSHTGGATVSNNPLTVNVTNGDISGRVTSFYNGINIPGVTLTAKAVGSPDVTAITDISGLYDLLGFGDGSYTVTPSKPDETRVSANTNISINSRDVTYIQRHRVGLPPNPDLPNDPNNVWTDKMEKTADVDQNNSVQSFDASLIQQFRAGIPNAVNQTGKWKFTPGSRAYDNVFLPQPAQDYTAKLLGDVDGSLTYGSSSPLAPANARTKGEPVEMVTRKNAEIAPNATAANVAVTLPTDNTYTVYTSFNAPISVGDVTGQGITSYDFDVLYDPAVIQPVGNTVDTSGTLSSSMSVIGNVVSPGRLAVSASGINPISGSGTLLKIVFKAVGTAGTASNLSFDPFFFNNGMPAATIANGKIQILGPTAATASLGGRLLTARGQGISSAQVVLTDTRGVTRTVVSGAFGNYRFSGLAAGGTYIITVNSKRYTFTAQAVSVTGDLAAVNLIANP